MLSKFLEIAHGWQNYISANPAVRELANRRLEECNMCPQRGEMNIVAASVIRSVGPSSQESKPMYQCNNCGCPLAAKVMSPESRCPIGKW